MYTSVDIAKGFLSIVSEKKGLSLSKTKLIKLCYIAHGYYLAVRGKKLFIDKIEAWQYGPVMPLLYAVLDFETIDEFYKTKEFDNDVKELIEFIWNTYEDYTAAELVEITHKKGSPWYYAYDEYDWNTEIPTDTIKKYYKKLLKV